MITGIEIQRIRGIHEGKLDGLTPLTVLVGPSGSGKSTILDALLIAASRSPGDSVGQVVQRRAELLAGAPWLFERGAHEAVIKLHGDGDIARTYTLRWVGSSGDFSVSAAFDHATVGKAAAVTTFKSVDNAFEVQWSGPLLARVELLSVTPEVHLIDTEPGTIHPPLVRVYEAAFQQGQVDRVNKLLPEVLDAALGLRVGTYQDGDRDLPLLHIEFADYSVPVAGAGSGVYAIVRLALELALPPGSLALVEEPEAHQHPSVIAQTAKLLRAAAQRGVQLIVSTHSLELIDALVADATSEDLERMSVVRVVLDKGILRSSCFPGPMVKTARIAIDEDLR